MGELSSMDNFVKTTTCKKFKYGGQRTHAPKKQRNKQTKKPQPSQNSLNWMLTDSDFWALSLPNVVFAMMVPWWTFPRNDFLTVTLPWDV